MAKFPPRGSAEYQEAIRAFVDRTRKAQGLPERVEDPVVIHQIVTIFRHAAKALRSVR